MKHFKEFDFDISKVKKYKSKKIEYYNLECAFDTETSSIEVEDKTGLCYIWMIGFGDSDEHIYYGRYLSELVLFLTELSKKWELSQDKRIIVYVHNLSFDFQFIQKYFKWIEVFATAKRNPIKVCSDLGFEFRDSLILSGYSLAKVGENLTKHTLAKAVGDLNYELTRTPITTLSKEEMYYCEMDIRVLLAYINEEIGQNGNITKIPLTNTGKVRNDIKKECFLTEYRNMCLKEPLAKQRFQKTIREFHEKINQCILEKKTYDLAKEVYQGGFTHADILYVNKTIRVGDDGIKRLISKDFTSSYPTVMISEKYPMSKPIPIQLDLETAEKYIDNEYVSFMTRIKMTNVMPKFIENYLSYSKCNNCINPKINNGRISSCDYLETSINELDLDIILSVYDFDSIEFFDSYQLKKQYLPTPIVNCIIRYYNDKTTLKDVDGKEAEYMLAKGKLNSIYGMCVMDLYKPEIELIDGEWIVDDTKSVDDVIEKAQTKYSRYLYYLWGVWVSAYARHNLWMGIIAAAENFMYSDTDSIKIVIDDSNEKEMEDYFKSYNLDIKRKLEKACDYHKLNYELLEPYTIDGVKKPLGVWDDDGDYIFFRTLGAKRYLTYDVNGKLKLTCAGVSKKKGLEHLCRISGVKIDSKGHVISGDVNKVFDNFNFYLEIPPEETGKMTHYYNDTTETLTITDYQGNTGTFETKGGVYLEKASFNININENWLRMIEDVIIGISAPVFTKNKGY